MGAAFALAGDVHATALHEARWPIFVVGLVLMLLGIALRQWSVFALGSFFTVQVQVREGQTVVDTGPYRYVRHPSYTAIMLTFFGMGVALENWLSLWRSSSFRHRTGRAHSRGRARVARGTR